jgi:hypothetical protein
LQKDMKQHVDNVIKSISGITFIWLWEKFYI